MANYQRRPELQIRDVVGMFKQASISFRASSFLFLTLALLSSIHEIAVERSALLSGFSLSAQNSTLSLQFSLDQKHPAAFAPIKDLNASSILRTSDAIDSLISRLLTAFLPPDDTASLDSSRGPASEASEGSATEAINRVREDVNDIELGENVAQSLDKVQADSQDRVPNDDMLNGGGSVSHSGHEREDSQLNKNQSPDGKAYPPPGESDDVKLFIEEDESLLDDLKKENEETYSDIGYTRLKIETVSNYTKASTPETAIDASELSLFTGKLLGGRGLDQGAYPHGGMTLLLVLFLLASAIAVFLAVIGFQHVIVLGSVVHSVVSTHMGKRLSPVRLVRSSMKSNVPRLIWLVFMYASLRGFENIFLMKTLFGGLMEMEQIEELVLRLSSATFPFLAPFTDVGATSFGMAVRLGIYVGLDYVFDGIVYCIYIIACWDTIMKRNNWFIGAISKSCNLIKTLQAQALVIRVVETMICGRTFRWILQQVIGQFGAVFIVSTVQMYFLVVWLIFYMSARSIYDQRPNFSHSTLEDFLDRFK